MTLLISLTLFITVTILNHFVLTISPLLEPFDPVFPVEPYDEPSSTYLFALRNPLSLFYPYRSSDDDMHISEEMQAAFDQELAAISTIKSPLSKGTNAQPP